MRTADYLELLSTQPRAAGLAEKTIEMHPGLVAVVDTGRERLAAISPPAADLVDQLAFCAPEPLPLIPRRVADAPAPEREFGVQVGDLATTGTLVLDITSLAVARQSGDMALQEHRLVQALLRDRMSPAEQTRTRRAARALVATATPGDAERPASWPRYAIITPHIQALAPGQDEPADDEPESFRQLLLSVTRYLFSSAQYAAGRALVEGAYGRWSRTLGENHPETLQSATNLATFWWHLANKDRARALLADTLDRCRRQFGDDHPKTLGMENNLGQLLIFARDLYEDTLAGYRRALGDDHPDTLTSAANLGVYLWLLGDFDRARALGKETLTGRRNVLGDDHPDTLASANNLAEGLQQLGDLAGARDLYEDTLARYRRALGDDHPDTLTSAANLGEVQRLLGEA
jgi:tetratricopeptide (TPR) repeat protein